MDKSTGFKTGRRQPQTTRKTCTKERFCNTLAPDEFSRVLGVAKRYCRKDSIGDSFVQRLNGSQIDASSFSEACVLK